MRPGNRTSDSYSASDWLAGDIAEPHARKCSIDWSRILLEVSDGVEETAEGFVFFAHIQVSKEVSLVFIPENLSMTPDSVFEIIHQSLC
jgi:hypothetical protein